MFGHVYERQVGLFYQWVMLLECFWDNQSTDYMPGILQIFLLSQKLVDYWKNDLHQLKVHLFSLLFLCLTVGVSSLEWSAVISFRWLICMGAVTISWQWMGGDPYGWNWRRQHLTGVLISSSWVAISVFLVFQEASESIRKFTLNPLIRSGLLLWPPRAQVYSSMYS